MIKKLITISCVALLISCGNSSTENTANTDDQKDTVTKEAVSQPTIDVADFQFQTLVINVPSPFEIITFLPKCNFPFNKSLLNITDNESKYTTTTKKGLNYGVYVVDLVYLSTNEQFSEVKNYFKTSKNLAQSLGCDESFNNIAGSRLEKNIDKKDTINKVIDQIYTEMDGYLRSNDRLLTATQILVGSWIESQYITVSFIKDVERNKDNDILFKKIIEQNFTSQKLVQLLKEYEKEKEFKATILAVGELDKIYSSIHNGELDKATLAKLYSKLIDARGKIVN